MLPAYPELGQAIESAKVVIANAFGGGADPLPVVVHHGYEVLGYGLSVALPEGLQAMLHSGPKTACSEDECKAHLESFVASKGGKMQAGAIPWLSIAMFLAELIQKWLKK